MDIIGNGTHDLPACGAVAQLTALPQLIQEYSLVLECSLTRWLWRIYLTQRAFSSLTCTLLVCYPHEQYKSLQEPYNTRP